MEIKGNASRMQSSLGSKLITSDEDIISTLILARVSSINYKENYVVFVPITTNSNSKAMTRGVNKALLPSNFAGRNGFGRSYGVINPVHPGDIILVGLVESDTAQPIVISRYPDDKVATELSDQPAEHYEPADFNTYANANKMTVVYPDQGYNIHDGRGNLTLKFSGNTFMLVRPDVPLVSHVTDDGDSPIDSHSIPGASDGVGQARNSIVQNAPEVIYGHAGNINTDGSQDNHAFYVYLGQDGHFRVSMMQKDQDWRTYFEQTPDGKIRLRRQEDSKIFGAGSKSSEIGIDSNGYVNLRSDTTGLVLRPDGIYNLDGTKFQPGGGGIDLSKVWESIEETKEGLKENKTQIEINSKGIATKVSTDELPDAINDQLKPYDDSLKKLQDSYSDMEKTLADLASDGIISAADKKSVRTIWMQIQTEYPAIVVQAETNGVNHDSLDDMFTTLKTYITPILDAKGDTTVDPKEWDRNFSNYYNAAYNTNTAIVQALHDLAKKGYDKAVDAAASAGDALTQVAEASSEDFLTGSDKASLAHTWTQIQAQYPNDVASADSVKVDHKALDDAYNALNKYITDTGIFKDNSTISVDGSGLADKIKAYFKAEAVVLKAVADKNIETLAQFGEDIDHQATSIKETSTKIAMSAENIQKQGDSLAVMQGKVDIMANLIKGGVSETDVTGIVNDSLSNTAIGSLNQFATSTATKGKYMNGNTGTLSDWGNGIVSDYIPVTAGKSYQAKAYDVKGTLKLSVAWYDSDKKFISGTEKSDTGDVTNTGTAPSNAAYARVSTDDINKNTTFMLGNAPDEWAPAYADVKGDADKANAVLKSVTDTQASVGMSQNANKNKQTTNTYNIDSMFTDGKLSDKDIAIIKALLDDTTTDNNSDNSLASQYDVDVSALNNYYGQLKTLLGNLIKQDVGSAVDVDDYKAKLGAYYNNRDTFLAALKAKIDALVQNAKAALDTANKVVKQVITNKYANFAVTVDGISTKVGEVSEKADNASEAASTAQSSADDAKNRAISAASAASAAQASANTTQESLDALTDDGNISPIEKQTLAKEYATIKSNKTIDLAQASKYSVDSTSYTNAESAVETLVDPILSDMTTTTAVDRDSYKSTFATYYNARTQLLNAIADVAKNAADAAQSDLNGFKTTTTKKFSEIDQTAEGIKQSVTDVTTTANNANSKINNLQVGSTNLQIDSDFSQSPTTWTTDGTTLDTTGTYAKITSLGTGNQRIYGAGNALDMTVGTQYVISFTAYSSTAGTTVNIGVFNDPSSFSLTTSPTRYSIVTSRKQTDAGTALSILLTKSGDVVYIGKIKVELGNTATDWSPAPADNASASDLNNFKTTTTKKFSEIDQTAEGIKQSVTDVTTTANNANSKINNLQVGGTNLIAGTSSQTQKFTIGKNSWVAVTNGNPTDHTFIPVTAGQVFTYQLYTNATNTQATTASVDGYSGTTSSNTWKLTWTGNAIQPGVSGYSHVTFTIPSGITMILATGLRLVTRVPASTTDVFWQEEKLEVGNTPTAWSPAPADNASASDLNNFKTTTTKKFSEIDQTAEGIKQSVTDVTTTANNASDKVNNLQVGGTNLVLGTANSVSITGRNISNENIPAYYLVKPLGELVTQAGSPITLSFDYTITGSLSGKTRLQYNDTPWGGGFNAINMVAAGHFSQTVLADSTYTGSTATGLNFRLDNFSGTITLSNLKLELGNIATAWSAAPQDTKVGGTNLQIDSDFKQSPTTWTTDGTTLDTTGTYAKITSLGTLLQRIYGAGNSLDMPVGTQYVISFTAYSPTNGTEMKVGVFNDPNPFSLTTSATRYSVNCVRKSTDGGSALSIILSNSGDVVYIGKIKVELGNMATDWSPAPADNASASDLAKTSQTVKTIQTQTANNWSIFAQGIGGTSAGISVDGNGTVTISGNKLVIGSDFIAGNITGKIITGSAFVNTFSHAQIDGAKSSGTLNISNSQISILGNIEDNNGNANGQHYNTNIGPNGLYNNITTPDNKGLMSQVALQRGALQLETLIGDPSAATKKYIQSEFTSADNVTFFYVNTTALSNIDIDWAYIYYTRRGNLVTVNFQFHTKANQYNYLRLADIRPGYTPYLKNKVVASCSNFSNPSSSSAIYSSTPSGGTVGWYGALTHDFGSYGGSTSYLTLDDYPTGDSYFR